MSQRTHHEVYERDRCPGKTETVYQLARQTQRNLMTVNVSDIKSKWVGDSEKNIQRLFDDYRHLVE